MRGALQSRLGVRCCGVPGRVGGVPLTIVVGMCCGGGREGRDSVRMLGAVGAVQDRTRGDGGGGCGGQSVGGQRSGGGRDGLR